MSLKRLLDWLTNEWLLAGIVVFLLAGLAIAVNMPAAAQGVSVAQWHGNVGGGTAMTQIIRSQALWDRLWERLRRPTPQPFHDGRQIAVMISLGERPHPGYGVKLVAVTPRDNRLVLVWQEKRRDVDDADASRPSDPWIVVLVNRGDLMPLIEQRVE